MVHILDGSCAVYGRISLPDKLVRSVVLFGYGVKQIGFRLPEKPSLIFNQISDPDTHQGSLKRCLKLVETTGVPVINPPLRVLESSREQVAEKLQDIPRLVMPKTIRFKPRSHHDPFREASDRGIELPFIVRVAGDHNGERMVLVENSDQIDSLYALPFDGRDFYLTQFVDFQSKDGLFRKTRIAVVDGVPMIRHHLINSGWMLHASSNDFMQRNAAHMAEARNYMAQFDATVRPAIADRISEISRRLGLDYYGIDCHISDQGVMSIFEANANMNILLIQRKEHREYVEAIKQQIVQLIANRCGG